MKRETVELVYILSIAAVGFFQANNLKAADICAQKAVELLTDEKRN